MKRFFLVLTAVLLPFATSAGATCSPDYSGVELTVSTQNGPFIASALSEAAKSWEARTCGKVKIVEFPFSELYPKFLTAVSQSTGGFDVIGFIPAWLPDLAPYLSSMPAEMQKGKAWEDIHPVYRERLMSWDGEVKSAAMDGDMHMLNYRADLFEDEANKKTFKETYGYDLAAPATWDRYYDIARFFNQPARGLYGAAEAYKRGGQQFWYFFSHAASYTNNPNNPGSMFFDPETMDAQINNPGWLKALEDYKKGLAFNPPGALNNGSGDVRPLYAGGKVAMNVDWGDSGILGATESSIKGHVRTAVLPGSKEIWNHKTRSWDKFDSPVASPFLAFGGWQLAVPADSHNPRAAWSFVAEVTSPEVSGKAITTANTGVNPYRLSHYNNLDTWASIFTPELVDADGNLTREAALLWNDKRAAPQVSDFSARVPQDRYFNITANMPTSSWPAFKLLWLMQNEPGAIARATTLLMPKDWINFRLTGLRAQDVTEGSLSFLMDWKRRDWSEEMAALTGIPRRLLPPLHDPGDILGGLSDEAAALLGLAADIPVLVGCGDYPMALLGSGVYRPGMGSDVTGTSSIITLLHERPVLDPTLSNAISGSGVWGTMTLLDAGGDAVRWARRAFHQNSRSYAEVAEAAARAEAGARNLFFPPYLSGERFGAYRNSRAQFFGLTAAHGLAELHRAVLEGVAFSVRQQLDALQAGHGRPQRIVAAGGGARAALWLKVKASMYGVPYLVPEEPECGIVGAAMLAATAIGDLPDVAAATAKMVRYEAEILPDPAWARRYDRMMPVYARLYRCAQEFYQDLDQLDQAEEKSPPGC